MHNSQQLHKHVNNAATLLRAVANTIETKGGQQDVALVTATHKASGEKHFIMCAVNRLTGTNPATEEKVVAIQFIPLALLIDEDPTEAYENIEEIPSSAFATFEPTVERPQLVLLPGGKAD